jgi:hypothetical protein
LHYEYRLNGVHRNPRTVTLPPADPVAPEHQTAFRSATEPLWRQLDDYSPPTRAPLEVGPPVLVPATAAALAGSID